MSHFHPEVDALDEEVSIVPPKKETRDAVISIFRWILGTVIFSVGAAIFVAALHLPTEVAFAMLFMAVGLAGMIKS